MALATMALATMALATMALATMALATMALATMVLRAKAQSPLQLGSSYLTTLHALRTSPSKISSRSRSTTSSRSVSQ